jgi:hypothetical protein
MALDVKKIVLRQGLATDIPLLAVGEPGFVTDTKEVIIGATGGNIVLSKVGHLHVINDITNLANTLGSKQNALISGENIKTINGATVIGSGNLIISGSGDWTFINKLITSNSIDSFTIDSTLLGEVFDFINFDYKFVYDGQTTDEDNSTPYIRFNDDDTPGRHSYIFDRLIAGVDIGEPTRGSSCSFGTSNVIFTGVMLGTASTWVGVTFMTLEFIVSRARLNSEAFPRSVFMLEGRGFASAAQGGASQPMDAISSTCMSKFVGNYQASNVDELNSIFFWHGITQGISDINSLRVYKRAK